MNIHQPYKHCCVSEYVRFRLMITAKQFYEYLALYEAYMKSIIRCVYNKQCFMLKKQRRCCSRALLLIFVFCWFLFLVLFHVLGDISEESDHFTEKQKLHGSLNNDVPGLKDTEFLVEENSEVFPVEKLPKSKKSTRFKHNGSKKDPTILVSNRVAYRKTSSQQYLFLLGHYEQLGKTTVNFLHAGYLAAQLKRNIVEPFVRNSRFCGLQMGWTGQPRKTTRRFLPMENYFSTTSFDRIFLEARLADIVSFEQFTRECKEVVMVYYFYAGSKQETKRYLQLSEEKYRKIEMALASSRGWIDCLFVEDAIKTSARLRNISISRALCVDPEIIKNVAELNTIIHAEKCVSLFLWRGIGYQRTHFNLTLEKPHEFYLSRIEFGALLQRDVYEFVQRHFGDEPYIGIHVRSERQLAWYSVEKFKYCLDLLEKVVRTLMSTKLIRHVFVASDMLLHGSDSLKFLNVSAVTQAQAYFKSKLRALNAVSFFANKSRGLIYNDAGFVALTEMEILTRSQYIVTSGAGTFQNWLIESFKKYQKAQQRPWSSTRVCFYESKI